MAVKRRTVWFSDEEWALLLAHGQEHGQNVSRTIIDMWELAHASSPADHEVNERIIATATRKLGHDPYREFHHDGPSGSRTRSGRCRRGSRWTPLRDDDSDPAVHATPPTR